MVVLAVAAVVAEPALARQLRRLPREWPARQDRADPAAKRHKQDKVAKVVADVAPPLKEDRKHPWPAWLF